MYNFYIIIPCYNESNRLDINQFLQFSQQHENYKILFVNDGSRDNTLDILKKLSATSENISFINSKTNMGKSHAVRYGILTILENYNTSNTYIGFLDADLSISTTDIDQLYKTALLQPKLDFLYYMKNKREYYKKKMFRSFISNVLNRMNKILYNIDIQDTQCGCKIFKSEIAKIVFKENFRSKWLFDLEIFLRLMRRYEKKLFNDLTIGINNDNIKYAEKSKIKTTIFFQLTFDYLNIYLGYIRKKSI